MRLQKQDNMFVPLPEVLWGDVHNIQDIYGDDGMYLAYVSSSGIQINDCKITSINQKIITIQYEYHDNKWNPIQPISLDPSKLAWMQGVPLD